MLIVGNVHVHHGHLHVLKEVDLQVREGEIVAVVGANGAGKSTLLGTIAGIYAPKEGEILFENEPLPYGKVEQVVERGICLVPERRQIFDGLSVKDNILLGAYRRYRRDLHEVKRDYEQVLELFPKLKTMLDRPGGLLSGGEQQMLAIARGLMAKPKLLLLDEPSLGLAPLIVKEMMELLKRLRDQLHTAIVLVEQNVRAALQTADYAYVLERGRIVANGKAADLLVDERVAEAYLGSAGHGR
ncbi:MULTISPECIES: ABC transporter ATP-binding protein [Geobacillus]|jgi:branched-chain amino acid transport system ATP-binding protein|uniref:Branched-chain amino acid ABC transporter ATP-binding protein n=2 Tax=Geobacillus thermodenitrificans TaxID=33940 RepID=A4ISM1_GEOTN|nr:MULTISPECIES: ABC transporter ATP-binding protein [Geobacillus]ABO68325.1 Branched-chain amino acid ABC transporter ATP-binding protein [Geobacillus thermodenitrificans NG80-2]ARA98551.1 branched-chain amino acid ABC transporter ATP-binding protein [Geobacillus thermodenitrificans]ARP44036.1 High-affinity branched-chain amino acid transport ATP-binding protein LivF [Geobacillus thermodenitrificans]ATO37934.1 branched-chain amino acid ABC transporter ATP-binding protein [Geobacillus thermoden